MSVRRNVSYEITPSHSTTSVQAVFRRAAGQNDDTDSAAANYDYSRIGPSYETINSRRQQPSAAAVAMMARSDHDQSVSQAARLSGRYEFSDAHLAATACTAGAGVDGGQKEAGSEYEVPQKLSTMQIEENEENEGYAHLQY